MEYGKKYVGNSGNDVINPSRSSKKREALALQKLGEELTKLSAVEREKINLPEELSEAIDLLEKITDHEGRRRQKQYIGRLMRDVDIKEIQIALDRINDLHSREVNAFQKAEDWRKKLLECNESEIAGLVENLLTTEVQETNSEIISKNDLLEIIKMARLQMRYSGKKTGATNFSKQVFRAITRIIGKGQKENS